MWDIVCCVSRHIRMNNLLIKELLPAKSTKLFWKNHIRMERPTIPDLDHCTCSHLQHSQNCISKVIYYASNAKPNGHYSILIFPLSIWHGRSHPSWNFIWHPGHHTILFYSTSSFCCCFCLLCWNNILLICKCWNASKFASLDLFFFRVYLLCNLIPRSLTLNPHPYLTPPNVHISLKPLYWHPTSSTLRFIKHLKFTMSRNWTSDCFSVQI